MRALRIPCRLVVCAANAAVLAALLTFAACGSSGNTYTTPTPLSKCAVAFDAPASTVPASGGGGAISVKTERECQWTAEPDVGWLSITAGASGQGDGSVQYNATANGDPIARTGGIMLNGKRAAVTQAAAECHVDLSNAGASFGQVGGSGSVEVRASSALCTWTAASDSDWITIVSGANSKGTAAVSFAVAPTSGPPRTGTLTIAGLRFSVTQSEGCTFAIAPPSYSAGPSGGSSVITVTAGTGCPWTASSNVNWISITSATSGSGNGTVGFSVAPTSGPPRTGTLTVAGQLFSVTQGSGCSVDVSPLTFSVDAGGGSRTVNVNAGSGCGWTAASGAPWISITSAAGGTGPGSVTFTVASTTGPTRSGTLTIAGQTVRVTQGQGCTFAIAPDNQSIPSAGGSGSVAVTAGGGCAWTAVSNIPWITIASGASGSGNGTVAYNVVGTTGPARTGSLTIAGLTFTINQGQGCTFAMSPGNGSAPAAGGSGSFDVRTSDGCGWSAASNATWLTITAGATGTGNGTVRYTAAVNSGPPRTGNITVGGQTFTLTQDVGCSYTFSPTSQNIGSGGGTIGVPVSAPADCAWSASSNAGWIGISSGNTGSGNGTVQLVVAPNSDAARQGTVTIANQPFTVIQASGCTFSISPSNQNVAAGGGSGTIAVTASGTCAWTATPNVPWIGITSGAGGNGNGTVQFAVASNSGAARTGTIAVAGQTFTITQDGGCSFVVSPQTIPAPAGPGMQSVSVSTTPDCAWTATSNAPWFAIAAGANGTGNGTVQLDIQANAGAPRSGTATIAGTIVTVNQDGGCTFSLAPSAQTMPKDGGPSSVAVTTSGGCAWSAISNVSWITITDGTSGSGSGTVRFTVDPNLTGMVRSGTLTIGGQTFTLEEGG
jgi:hypothetical protein